MLAAESASFTMAYTRAGLSPDGSSSYFLPRLIGITKTKELMLTNSDPDISGGVAVGTGHRGCSRRRTRRRTDTLAEPNGATARDPKRVKALLLSRFQRLEEQMELEGRLIAESAESADGSRRYRRVPGEAQAEFA